MRSDAMGSRVWFDPIGLSVEPGTTVRWIVRENVHTTMRAPPPGGPSSPPPGARFVAVFAFMFAVGLGALWEIFDFAMAGVFGLNMQKSAPDCDAGIRLPSQGAKCGDGGRRRERRAGPRHGGCRYRDRRRDGPWRWRPETSCWCAATHATCHVSSRCRAPATEKWYRICGGRGATTSRPSPSPPGCSRPGDSCCHRRSGSC